MRKSDRLAEEKREERRECYEVTKMVVGHVFSHPTHRRNLAIGLLWPNRNKEQRERLINDLVEEKAQCCLNGDPKLGTSAEFECHWLVEMVDYLGHVHLALEQAVDLYREAGKAMPQPLSEWAVNRRDSGPKKRGPSLYSQDWKVLRDLIIAHAIGCAEWVQNDPNWWQKLLVGRAYASEEEWRPSPDDKPLGIYSICRAVVEVLEERHGSYQECHLPTYNMVWNAWQRYKNVGRTNGNTRGGLPLLPPQGLEQVLNPPGIDTTELRQNIHKISEDHVRRFAERDLNDGR